MTSEVYTPVVTVYSLTPYDYPLLIKAGFRQEGTSWDVLWGKDVEGIRWQVSADEDIYLKFYEHDAEYRRKDPRNMTRQEFQRKFGV